MTNAKTQKKYEIIYADPPWQFSNVKTGGSMTSGSEHQYKSVTGIESLKQMDVESIAAENCVLIMWYAGAMPKEAIELVEAWGFKIKNMNGFFWNKLTVKGNPFFGMGFWTRAGSESAIIAIKGKPKPESRSVRAVGNAEPESFESVLSSLQFDGSYKVGKHSAKPLQFRDKCVELMGDVPRLEMFARETSKGWDVFGNEVKNSIAIPTKGATVCSNSKV